MHGDTKSIIWLPSALALVILAGGAAMLIRVGILSWPMVAAIAGAAWAVALLAVACVCASRLGAIRDALRGRA